MISAGVAVVCGAVSSWHIWEIEFHLSANKTQESHTSHVTSILFRFTQSALLESLRVQGSNGLEALDETLLHLPHLAKVVLETFDLNDSATFASGMVHMANRIHRQTCAQSQRLAPNEELSAEDGDQVVVSPRWYPNNDLGYSNAFW